ncbi:MAG: hypothetical protein CMH62_03565 [Nanoarchaeota archaeon]|nr:hypothetical protein [Nanoarchaeota archaeon]|tara:strand:- start:1284 stop:2726 length:1443 start_codon:yes stop_codon:yes gene_type:complete
MAEQNDENHNDEEFPELEGDEEQTNGDDEFPEVEDDEPMDENPRKKGFLRKYVLPVVAGGAIALGGYTLRGPSPEVEELQEQHAIELAEQDSTWQDSLDRLTVTVPYDILEQLRAIGETTETTQAIAESTNVQLDRGVDKLGGHHHYISKQNEEIKGVLDDVVDAGNVTLGDTEGGEEIPKPKETEKPEWKYNGNYDFYEWAERLDGSKPDGKQDAFRVKSGNTIAGGILDLARSEGHEFTNDYAVELSDKVCVFRDGKVVENIDPTNLQVGDVVYFTDAVQDAIYGTQDTSRDAGNVTLGDMMGGEPSDLEESVGNHREILFNHALRLDNHEGRITSLEDGSGANGRKDNLGLGFRYTHDTKSSYPVINFERLDDKGRGLGIFFNPYGAEGEGFGAGVTGSIGNENLRLRANLGGSFREVEGRNEYPGIAGLGVQIKALDNLHVVPSMEVRGISKALTGGEFEDRASFGLDLRYMLGNN